MKVMAFSNYLIYNVGGAEPSLIHLLDVKYPECEKTIYSFEKPAIYKTKPLLLEIPKEIGIKFIPRKFEFSFLPFLEYCLNRGFLKKEFAKLEEEQMLASSIYAPVALNFFNGKGKIVFIQSDMDLGRLNNQEVGLRWFLKSIYNIFQSPFVYVFRSDLRKAMLDCEIICNSNYTKTLIKKYYGVEKCSVKYPIVDEVKLLKSFQDNKIEIENRGIVFIGDSAHKGLNVAKAISRGLEDYVFYFFSKRIKEKEVEGNINYMPWVVDVAEAYKFAELVIVPSQWEETYGRVAREADVLSIPVLVSNIGGLPEAVSLKKECLVDDYKNPEAWIKRIKETLDHGN